MCRQRADACIAYAAAGKTQRGGAPGHEPRRRSPTTSARPTSGIHCLQQRVVLSVEYIVVLESSTPLCSGIWTCPPSSHLEKKTTTRRRGVCVSEPPDDICYKRRARHLKTEAGLALGPWLTSMS